MIKINIKKKNKEMFVDDYDDDDGQEAALN